MIAAPLTAGALILLCLVSESLHLGRIGRGAPALSPPARFAHASPHADSTPPARAMPETVDARTRLELEALREEKLHLTDRNSALENQLSSLLQWMLTNLKGTVPLQESSMTRLAFQGVTGNCELDPEVARFLNITPEETALINDAFSYSRDEIQRLIGENLAVSVLSEDQVLIEVAPYPADGAAVQQDLNGALAATLGEDRFQRFVDTTAEGLKAGFSRFGDGLHSLSFQWVLPEEGSGPQLVVRDGWLFENDQNRMQIITTESTFDEWPEEYRDWLPWISEDFDAGS